MGWDRQHMQKYVHSLLASWYKSVVYWGVWASLNHEVNFKLYSLNCYVQSKNSPPLFMWVTPLLEGWGVLGTSSMGSKTNWNFSTGQESDGWADLPSRTILWNNWAGLFSLWKRSYLGMRLPFQDFGEWKLQGSRFLLYIYKYICALYNLILYEKQNSISLYIKEM